MMNCPKCDANAFIPAQRCPACGFTGDAVLLTRLDNLHFLLAEIDSWFTVPPRIFVEHIRPHYERKKREVEVALGLRQPAPTVVETAVLRTEMRQWHHWLETISQWVDNGWLTAVEADFWRERAQTALANIEGQLVDAPPAEATPPPKFEVRRLEKVRFLLVMLTEVRAAGHLSEVVYETIEANLTKRIERLEWRLGYRAQPEPQEAEILMAVGEATDVDAPVTDAQAAPKRRGKRPAWTWDRVWETLLSERTLRAVLFLGVVLLLGAAVSWVAANWRSFSAVAQLGILGGGTAVFYGLGWYVRVQQGLRESGIALSAVASLLIPLDFFVFYLSGGFPAEAWPQVWLGGSLTCLGVYLLATYLIEAPFFGYLVAAAMSSGVVALLNIAGVGMAGWQVGVAATALVLAASSRVDASRVGRWQLLQIPFGQMALLLTVPLLLVGVGLGYIVGGQSRLFYVTLAASWWLGGAVLALMVARYRLHGLMWATALTFPVAMWLTQSWLLAVGDVRSSAWQGVGLVLLAPIYLGVARRLGHDSIKEVDGIYGRIVLQTGSLIMTVAAIWSLLAVPAATVVHGLLAVVMVRTAVWWRQPRWLWLMSLFLGVSVGAAQAWQGVAEPAELALVWSLLAVGQVVVAVRLAGNKVGYDTPLYGTAVLLAGAALLPPLILWNRLLFTYALGNWVGVTAWLAYLSHSEQYRGVNALVAGARWRRWRYTLFHWLAALALVPWLGLLWPRHWAASLPLFLAVVAWGLLGLNLRLRRWRWGYGGPWQLAAHWATVAALGLALLGQAQPWWAVTSLLIGSFYFVAARAWSKGIWLVVGGFVWVVGLIGWLDGLGFALSQIVVWVSLLAVIYSGMALVGEALLAEQSTRIIARQFFNPFYRFIVTILLFILLLLMPFTAEFWFEVELVRVALSWGMVGVSVALLAWSFEAVWLAHVAFWLITIGGGLFVKVYSQGSGRSAALVAVVAVLAIVAERGLHRMALSSPKTVMVAVWRKGWRLYRQPLLWGGWLISVGAVGAAMGRNLLWLGGGVTRQTWSIVALLIVTGLYVACAYWFKKMRFAWLAALLVVLPWTLLADLRWYMGGQLPRQWFGPSWIVLGWGLVVVAMWLRNQLDEKGVAWWQPPLRVAQGVLVVGFLWGLADVADFVADFVFSHTLFLSWGQMFLWVMVFKMGAAVLSALLLRRGVWLYGATLLLPPILLLLMADVLGRTMMREAPWFYGWGLLLLAGLYVMIAWTLRRLALRPYDQPWLVTMFPVVLLALLVASGDEVGALIGYGGAALVWGVVAVWRRWPWLLHGVVRLAGVAYWVMFSLFDLSERYVGLAFWPGILICLGVAWWLDIVWGVEPDRAGIKLTANRFPWHRARAWLPATWERLTRWWALPFYIVAFMSVGWSGLLALDSGASFHLPLVLGWGTAVYTIALFRFRLRGWLLVAWGWLQLTWVATLAWFDVVDTGPLLALWFLPMTLLTALMGAFVARLRFEGAPLGPNGDWWRGWSRPFYWILALNMLIGQALVTSSDGYSVAVTIAHMILLVVLVTHWRAVWLAYIPTTLGVIAVTQLLNWLLVDTLAGVRIDAWVTVFWSLLALVYGTGGYVLAYRQREEMVTSAGWLVWQRPLQRGGWAISWLVLIWVLGQSLQVAAAFFRVGVGEEITGIAERLVMQAVVLDLAILGLFYLMAAVVARKRWWGYGALLLLLNAWTIWLAILQVQQEWQLYALPAGVYLLGVGWAEWQMGNRDLARWIDRAGLLLLFGSAFWQSFGAWGGLYALLLIMEGLLIAWLGSLRRLRRLLYAGVLAVVTAVVGQLVEPLLALNTFVLLILGALLVILGIALEQRLERIRQYSETWLLKLEDWE